ncbi:membrane protein insertion efficiency factor YidD [Pseudomonas syringae]|nr:membrane protein insertion efficiency factor YidD [Pseudomonas syringae]
MKRWFATTLISIVRGYQLFISPSIRSRCRFYPTCSQYSVEALQTHGAVKGTWLMLRRVCRCHPLHLGGYDPVPPSTPKKGDHSC